MRGKGQRFAKEESMTEESVGPGRYMITEGSLAADAKRSMERASKVNPAFGSRVPQRALPFASAGQETPGPGSYQAKIATPKAVGSSAFRYGGDQLTAPAEQGDPGAYSPYDLTDLAASTSATFSRSTA